MEKIKIKKKDADYIIKALEGGVVPSNGIAHLLVGRDKEVNEIINILTYVKDGNSDIRFWVGDYGSGKSFMLRTIENLAIAKNFVVSTVDLTPGRRFHSSDGKSRALYKEIMDNLAIRTSRNENTLNIILEQWFQKLISQEDLEDLESPESIKIIHDKILDITTKFSSSTLAYEFSHALLAYYMGIIKDDRVLRINAIRFLKGDIETKTESRNLLKINNVIDDDSWFEIIKNLSVLFREIGYSGFVVNFDETVNLYKLPLSKTRERNYEKVLNMFNEAKTGKAKGLFINFGSTRRTIFDENRGMSSYGALKGRLGSERDMDTALSNVSRTVLPLKPLSNEDIFTLLENLVNIYNVYRGSDLDIKDSEIQMFMEEELNRPGAAEFLTPRAVIKDFLEILGLLTENIELTFNEVMISKFNIKGKRVNNESDDDVEIL